MKLDIPERFKATVYVCAYSDPSSPLYGVITTRTHNPEDDYSLILLGQNDVDIPLDASGTLDKQVAQMRQAKQRIIDEATEKAGQIDEAIESLLAIEYKDGDQ